MEQAPRLRLTSKTLRCRGAQAVRLLSQLIQCQSWRDAPWPRAAAEALVSASAASVSALRSCAGAARRRAVGQCQVTWVASFGGDGSPSNNCLERAVIRLRWCAASAGKKLCARVALAALPGGRSSAALEGTSCIGARC